MRELTRTRQAVGLALFDIERGIRQEGRLRTLTGGIFDRITTTVSQGAGYVVGQLEADDYWRFVGNGRGPGGMPPVQRLREWVQRAGVQVDPWALAKSIEKRGTRAWRRKERNVFEAGIEKWENSSGLADLEEAAGVELEERAIEVIKRNLKR